MRARIIIISGLISLLFCTASFADVPLETAAGTIITAEGFSCYLQSNDSMSNPLPNSYAATIETVVAAMYGFDPLADLTDWNNTTPGNRLTYVYVVTNEGNANDTAWWGPHITTGGAAGFDGFHWTVLITAEGYTMLYLDGNVHIDPAGYWWGNSQDPNLLAKGANRTVYMTVTPSILETESPDGAYLMITLEGYSISTPIGVYYGANNITYGGTSEIRDLTYTCIASPVMKMTRVATVDAPRTTNGKYSGGAHDAVPGAVITFSLLISNEGSVSAKNVQIMNNVPYVGGTMTTWLCHVGAGTGFQGTIPNVTITAPSPDATGWKAYYSIYAFPMTDFGYIGPQWVTVDAWPAYVNNSSAMWVKFEKATVTASEDAKTINWGVTIR
jgi:hypothetical protein